MKKMHGYQELMAVFAGGDPKRDDSRRHQTTPHVKATKTTKGKRLSEESSDEVPGGQPDGCQKLGQGYQKPYKNESNDLRAKQTRVCQRRPKKKRGLLKGGTTLE